MNKKRCNALLPLVQLLPAVAAAAAVLFALPRTVPVLAAVPERLTAVVEQPSEAASSEAEEEALPKLPYADGVYVGSSRGYGGAVRVQVTMENGSITEVEILDASHETRQFLRRAKRLLTTVVEAQSWEVDAVSEATYTSRGILGAVQNALTGEVVNNPLPPQPEPATPLVVEEFTAPSTYLDGIYTAEAMGFEGEITVQVTVAEDKITDITLLSAEDEEEYLSQAKQVIPAILEGQSPNVDAVSGATYSSTGILNAVKLALAKAAVAPAEEDLAVLCQAMLNGGIYKGVRLYKKEVIDEFTSEQNGKPSRGLGFERGSSFMGRSDRHYDAFGHAGFTGTHVVMNKTNKTAVIFLTNKQNVGFKPDSTSYYSPYSCCGEICELVWNIFGTEAPAETLADKIGTWL